MHRTYCKSLVILTSYPPQYQKCNCGEDDVPKEWHKDLREQAKDKYEEFKMRYTYLPTEDITLFAIILDRLGGSITITHEEMVNFNPDRVWYRQENNDRSITIRVE